MATLDMSRKQRLRTLENQIRKAAEQIPKNGLEIGRYLCEIRDDELWAEDYPSWNQYLKAQGESLVGKSFAQSAKLIQAAEVQKRIPEKISPNVKTNLAASHLSELGRLAPNVGRDGERGAEKDYTRLRKQDVARVIGKAQRIAGDGEAPSVRDIRKAVDEELGIDRAKQAKETARQRAKGIDLADYMRRHLGSTQGTQGAIDSIPDDAWRWLHEEHPQLIGDLVEAHKSMMTFFERVISNDD